MLIEAARYHARNGERMRYIPFSRSLRLPLFLFCLAFDVEVNQREKMRNREGLRPVACCAALQARFADRIITRYSHHNDGRAWEFAKLRQGAVAIAIRQHDIQQYDLESILGDTHQAACQGMLDGCSEPFAFQNGLQAAAEDHVIINDQNGDGLWFAYVVFGEIGWEIIRTIECGRCVHLFLVSRDVSFFSRSPSKF